MSRGLPQAIDAITGSRLPAWMDAASWVILEPFI
jgi:hypothetical protein